MVEHARKRGHKYEDRRDFESDHRPVLAGERLRANATKQQRLIGRERGFFSRVVKSLARLNTSDRMAGCSRIAASRSWSTVAIPMVFQGMERVRRPLR